MVKTLQRQTPAAHKERHTVVRNSRAKVATDSKCQTGQRAATPAPRRRTGVSATCEGLPGARRQASLPRGVGKPKHPFSDKGHSSSTMGHRFDPVLHHVKFMTRCVTGAVSEARFSAVLEQKRKESHDECNALKFSIISPKPLRIASCYLHLLHLQSSPLSDVKIDRIGDPRLSEFSV